MGLRLVVRGRLITSGAIVANHASWLDIMAVRATGLVYFVSKDDVASWPGVGFIARVSGTVFIERRRTEAKRQERVLLDRIAARQVLCIFPEGTSTDGLRVLPFKSSLFSAFFVDGAEDSVLIQPVTIRYHVAPGSGLPDSFYGWWGTMGFEPHVWNVLCRSRGGRVGVTFHDAVRPRDLGTRKTLAEHCGRTVAEALPVA
jgi:1-acyl-sn-glycerol-3-phosphate acyltransferase